MSVKLACSLCIRDVYGSITRKATKLPFYGRASIRYKPTKRLFSKIQRPVIAHGDVRQRPTTARWRTVKQTRVKLSCKDRPYSLVIPCFFVIRHYLSKEFVSEAKGGPPAYFKMTNYVEFYYCMLGVRSEQSDFGGKEMLDSTQPQAWQITEA